MIFFCQDTYDGRDNSQCTESGCKHTYSDKQTELDKRNKVGKSEYQEARDYHKHIFKNSSTFMENCIFQCEIDIPLLT